MACYAVIHTNHIICEWNNLVDDNRLEVIHKFIVIIYRGKCRFCNFAAETESFDLLYTQLTFAGYHY